MTRPRIAALLAAALLAAPAARAATAHNSQAGGWGPTSHNCAPTPYFPEGDCLPSYIEDDQDRLLLPPPLPPAYRTRAPRPADADE